jgi:hypothetical protein
MNAFLSVLELYQLAAEGTCSCFIKMLRKHFDGEMEMISKMIIIVCSVFVARMRSPSYSKSFEETEKHAILSAAFLRIYVQLYTSSLCDEK